MLAGKPFSFNIAPSRFSIWLCCVSQVAREQRAFTNLIEFKSHVVVPIDSGPGSQVSRRPSKKVQAMTHPPSCLPTHSPTHPLAHLPSLLAEEMGTGVLNGGGHHRLFPASPGLGIDRSDPIRWIQAITDPFAGIASHKLKVSGKGIVHGCSLRPTHWL